MGFYADIKQIFCQGRVVNIAFAQGFGPDVVLGLAKMQLSDSWAVELQDIEEGYRRVAGAAINPVGIEAQRYIGRVCADHHVVKLTRCVAQFDIVVVIRQRKSHRF